MDMRFSAGIEDARTYAVAAKADLDAGHRDSALAKLAQAETAFEDADKRVDATSASDVRGELLILRGELDMIKARVKA